MKMTRQNQFLLVLGAATVGYLAVNEYRRYQFEKLKQKALTDPSCTTCVREVFETIGSHSPDAGDDVITVTQSGLPSCDQMFPAQPDGIEVLRQMLMSGGRALGKCK